jgi:hypothetical protein
MEKSLIYDDVGGCVNCPFDKECIDICGCDGYTMDDEYGECPPELIVKYKALQRT